MLKEYQSDPRKLLVPRVLPWLLGAAMLIVYLFTLNPWVTLANILPVSKVSGFVWQPEYYNPLFFLVTLPFRLLPTSVVPLALNLFSAVCAAVTLALLARSVAILPQDRTEAQRQRERSDFSFLTTKDAWLPPVLAVVMFGLQFGFWQNATSFTGEMLALLVFAVVIWLLLEYRLDERPGRLTLAALIYGAGMADNWAMIGFLPLFITALIWLRRSEFFNFSFLARMALCGLAGLSLLLVLPIVGQFSSVVSLSFWELLKPALRIDWLVIKSITRSDIRHSLILMSVTTFLPLLVMAIRWSSSFGDSSHIGKNLTQFIIHLIHPVVFVACVWVMFDPPFSPGQLAKAMGAPALTFYYLSALGIGYFCGYLLLVFGKGASAAQQHSQYSQNPRHSRHSRTLTDRLGQSSLYTPVIYWFTYAAAALAVGTLIFTNFPQIRAFNDDTLLRYARWTEQNLPAGGGILLSDSEGLGGSQPIRTLLIQSALARSGRTKDYVVVDTQALNGAPYLRFLHKKFPTHWPPMVGAKDMGQVNPLGLLSVLNLLSQSNNLCYLNPSFGYYFELFYQEPLGLVYPLKTLPEKNLLSPPLATNLITANQKFWTQIMEDEFPRLEKALTPADKNNHPKPVQWVLDHLHGQKEVNPNALYAASLYSRALNFWGVQLQRGGRLPAAAECFARANQINPDNITASINLEFNQVLQSGKGTTIDPNQVTTEQFGKYRDWNSVLAANGPFDEPSFVFANAALLAQGGYMRQAVGQFARVRELAPDNLPARLMLGQLYLFNRLPDPALEALHDPLTAPARFGLNKTNATELNVLASAGYFQKSEIPQGVKLLELEISRHPDDLTLLTTTAQAYFMRGLYTNALGLINRQLVKTPDDPQWLFGQGYAFLQLSNYNQAITTLTRVLDISTNDPTARFNRALAYLQSGRLNDARADYLTLQTAHTNSYQVAFGLAEVAWRQHATNDAIRNYEIYLVNAPTNSAEFQTVRERLTQLRGQ